jgi:hypothetical protein
MAEDFDARTKAVELENLALTYLDNPPGAYPIEQSAVRLAIDSKLRAEFQDITSSQPHADAVGKELEKLGATKLSTLPNVEIRAAGGHFYGVKFTPSAWDWSADGRDSYSLDMPNATMKF